jgi:two-component system LytT family response regulator
MIKTIIVDDECPAREVLRNWLTQFCPDVAVIADAGSVKTAIESIYQHDPDLVFLDIELPDGDGFEMLRKLNRINFKIIFVTAFSEYALKAFRFYATDYLLKPVNISELMEAVNKVRHELGNQRNNQNIMELLQHNNKFGNEFPVIVIPDKKGFRVLNIQDIICCEADGYCTNFIMVKEKNCTSSKNLKFYEELLEENGFMRVHNSHIVNMKHVNGYMNEGLILLSKERTVPLGNTYKKRFTEWFNGRK